MNSTDNISDKKAKGKIFAVNVNGKLLWIEFGI